MWFRFYSRVYIRFACINFTESLKNIFVSRIGLFKFSYGYRLKIVINSSKLIIMNLVKNLFSVQKTALSYSPKILVTNNIVAFSGINILPYVLPSGFSNQTFVVKDQDQYGSI